jgi:hypothetical protein
MRRIAAIVLLILTATAGVCPRAAVKDLELPVASDGKISFDAQKKQVSAAVEDLSLKEAMAKFSGATGWKVFLDPAAERTVSAQFSSRSTSDGLRLLLGGLSFAVIPQTNGATKLYVFKNAIADATEEIPPKEASKRGKDWLSKEVLVTLKKGSRQDIDALARLLGAKIVGRNDKLRTYRLEFGSDEAAENARQRLASSPDLRTDDNYALRSPDSNGNPGAVGAPRFDLKPSADGTTTTVAVVDTAVQKLNDAMNKFLLAQVDVAGAPDPAQLASSTPMHGTSMTETILNAMADAMESGEETNIRILPVNVYGNREATTTYDVMLGVYEAVMRGADIVNLSLGGEASSPLMDDLIYQARKQGVLFFAAAGNVPTTAPTYPAANPLVYAVTAGDRNGNFAPYANQGAFIDLIAPGTTFLNYGGQTFRVMGTSPATAVVSGAAAVQLSRGANLPQIDANLREAFGLRK